MSDLTNSPLNIQWQHPTPQMAFVAVLIEPSLQECNMQVIQIHLHPCSSPFPSHCPSFLTNSQGSFHICLSSQTMTKLNTVFDGEARDPGNKKQLIVDMIVWLETRLVDLNMVRHLLFIFQVCCFQGEWELLFHRQRKSRQCPSNISNGRNSYGP